MASSRRTDLLHRRSTVDRAWVVATAVLSLLVIRSTTLGVDIRILPARVTTDAAYGYVALYLALAWWPSSRRLHAAALAASWLLWFGRAVVAFVDYADGGGTVLLTVTGQSALIGCMATALHIFAIRSVAASDAINRTTPHGP